MSTDEKPRNRTERQRLRTRRQLIAAGRALIASKGVPGLRIQQITEHADVALGSFYNYFDSKEVFVDAVISESLAELVDGTMATLDDAADPAELVARACIDVIRLAYDDPEFARLLVNIAHSQSVFGDALHPRARQAVERGVASGRFVVSDIEVLLTAVLGGAIALIREILEGRHGPHAELAFSRYVLAALGVGPKEAADVVAARFADSEKS